MLHSCFFVEEEDRCCERRVAYDYSLHLRNLHHLKQGNIAKLYLHLRNLHHEKQRNTAKLSVERNRQKGKKKTESRDKFNFEKHGILFPKCPVGSAHGQPKEHVCSELGLGASLQGYWVREG
jgi:hypothetical protein